MLHFRTSKKNHKSMKQKLSLFFLTLFYYAVVNAQPLIGTKNIPGDYADLATAIAALNTNGVGIGGVTFNVLAANPQTATTSGYIITANGTAANPIVFKGNNNTVTGVGTTGFLDGIFILSGADYVTIDSFALVVTDATVEFGVALLKPTANEGCQYNTISNCTITLNKTNTSSRGIFSNHHNIAATTILSPTTVAGTNSYNKFINNTISNVGIGIALNGFNAGTPYDYYDQQNEINKTGTGRNYISNFGNASASTGIFAVYNNRIKMANTNINGGTAGNVYGIYVAAALNATVDVLSDSIELQSTATSSTMNGIFIESGVSGAGNTITVSNCLVQNCSYTTAATSTFNGIRLSGTATYSNIQNNVIKNNTLSGTGDFAGINYGGTNVTVVQRVNINNNEVSGNSKTGTSGVLNMILANASTTTTNIYNNALFNNTQNVASGGLTYGIYNASTAINENIYNNQINNCTSGTGTFIAIGSVGGNTTNNTNKNIYNNKIYDLTSVGTVIGIGINNATKAKIYKNEIYKLTTNTTSGAKSYGIQLGNSLNNDIEISNNIISELYGPTSGVASIIGIDIAGQAGIGNYKLYHNTVYINATSTATNFGSAAVSLATNIAAFDMRNNILVNRSTANGTGITAVFRNPNQILAPYSISSGYNCMYAGSPSTTNVIYTDGVNNDQTLQAFKNRATPRDQSSFTELPPFVNITTSPYDLHLSGSSQCESGGQALALVTTDFDNNTRNASTPDVGADEFAGTAIDMASPNIQYTALGNDVVASSRTVNAFATITDPSLVNTTAGTSPRLYYKKKTQANTYNDNTNATDGWKYVEASNTTSPFSFTIDYTKLLTGAVVAADTIQYFVTAQDLATTPNVGINAGAFTTQPTSVNVAAANFPLTSIINQYGISASVFNGLVNVGTGESITSLTNASGLFHQLKTGTVSGNVTVNITSDLTAETGTYALANWSETGIGNYTLTIAPSAAVVRNIIGNASTGALIRLDNADRVTIDGRFASAGQYLLFRNTNATAPTIGLYNDAQNNTIRNCIIESGNTFNNTSIGNFLGAVNIGNTNVAEGTGNDNNQILYNDIRDRSDASGFPLHGIYSAGTTAQSALFNSNNTVAHNNIYNFFSTTNNTTGITVATGCIDYTIDNNSIYQTASRTFTTTITNRAIVINQSSTLDIYGGHTITNNYIGGTAPKATGGYYTQSVATPGTLTSALYGIQITSGTKPSVVSGNVVKNIEIITNAPTGNSVLFGGLLHSQGVVNINNNQIGANTGNDSIKINIAANTSTNASAFVIGIYSAVTSAGSKIDIENNIVGAFTMGGTIASTTTGGFNYNGIYVVNTPLDTIRITNNTIGSTTTPHSIKTREGATYPMGFYGIRFQPSNNVTPIITGNIVANMTDSSTNATSSVDYAIQLQINSYVNASPIVSNNTITNFTTYTGLSGFLQPIGIIVGGYAGNNIQVANNTINGFHSANTGAAASIPNAIFAFGSQGTYNISKNKIMNITNANTGAGPRLYGIYSNQTENLNVVNNSVSITNGTNTNDAQIVGISSNMYNATTNYLYNTVYIGGTNSGASNSYGYWRQGRDNVNLKNNLIYLDRTGGTGINYAMGSVVADMLPNVSYNTYITPTSNVNEYGIIPQDFAEYKTSVGGNKESYNNLNTNVTAANLFTDAANGDLTIKTANVESWYANNKAIAGAVSNNTATDFAGNTRGTTLGMPTDIGAYEFTPDAGVLPPSATASGAPAVSTTTTYTFAGRKLGEIVWGASVPATLDWKYFPGLAPTGTTNAPINATHTVTATGTAPYNYDIKLHYTEAEQNQMPDASLVGIKKDGANPWVNIMGTPAIDANGKFVLSTGLTSFSSFSLASSTTLPLHLLSFNGVVNAQQTVDLKWEVTLQTDVLKYEVERSANGLTFSKIGTLQANNLATFTYTLNDAIPIIGKNYYRLKVIENNGTSYYSTIVLISISKKSATLIYPIPAKNTISFVTNDGALMHSIGHIINIEGKIVAIFNINSFVEKIDISKLTKGHYFIKTSDGNINKFVKQ